jgi:hypothetical protein
VSQCPSVGDGQRCVSGSCSCFDNTNACGSTAGVNCGVALCYYP